MFLDFNDVNNDIKQFQSQGSISKINGVVRDAYAIVEGALSIESKAIDKYNKVSQILISDGHVSDITPLHLKATAASVIQQEAINSQTRLDRIHGTLTTLATDQVTTPLTIADITANGTIISYDMGILIMSDRNYINPAEFIRSVVGLGRMETIDCVTGSSRWFLPIRFTPLSRMYSTANKVLAAHSFNDRQLYIAVEPFWQQSGGAWVSDYTTELYFSAGGSTWDGNVWTIPVKTKNITVHFHVDNGGAISANVYNGNMDISAVDGFVELVTNQSFDIVTHPLEEAYRIKIMFSDTNLSIPTLRVGPAHSTVAGMISSSLGVDRLANLPAHLMAAATI